MPTVAPAAPSQSERAVRLLAAIRVASSSPFTALVLAIAALADVVSFEAIRAFAIETAAFPPTLAWSAPLLVDSFTTAASLVILWRYLRGDAWRDPWYAWTPGRRRHGRSGRPQRRPRPRPAGRPAVRRPAPGRPAGSAGAADERGPHRPAAHQPHTRRGGRDRRGRHRVTSRAPTATAPRPRSPCRRTAHRVRTRTRRPQRMRASRCGRWSPTNAQAARP